MNSVFEDKRRMIWNAICWGPAMLRHQAAENSLTTSGAAEKNFSHREMIVVAGFLNSSREHHIFSDFKHGFCEKIMRKIEVREAHFPF